MRQFYQLLGKVVVRSIVSAIALSSTISASTLASTDSLWQLVDSSSYQSSLESLSLPLGAVSPRAVSINSELLHRMEAGDLLELEIAENNSHQYRMGERRQFANGDLGWVGTFYTSNTSDTNDTSAASDNSPIRYSLSLTLSGELVLGSFYSPAGKYRIQAARLSGPTDADSNEYVGWLYGNPQNFESVAYEGSDESDDLFAGLGSISARSSLTGNDVTISQTIPEANVVIGEEFELTVNITNYSAEELVDKSVLVGALLHTATYVDGPAFCEPEVVLYGPSTEQELFCNLDYLAVGDSIAMTFRVIATKSSYPALPSIVIIDEIVDSEFMFVSHNTLMDSDNDGFSDFNENILHTDPNDSLSMLSEFESVEIDVLVLYTQKFADDVIHGSPEAEINQFMQEANAMFAASGAAVSYNPVYYGLTSHDVDNDIGASWQALRSGQGQSFADVGFLRIIQGADLVLLVDGDYEADVEGSCGIANLGGVGSQGDLSHVWWQEGSIYTAVYRPNSYNPYTNQGCDETVLAHELGHLMGLAHSRIENETEGTFAWARGHGEDGLFHTIMAYSNHFPGSPDVPVFSNPQSMDCFGEPCGVTKNDYEQGADAVLALNTTRFAVANYMQTRPALSVATLDGSSTGATMLAGAAITALDSEPDYLFRTNFKPSEAFSLMGSINVAAEHIGVMGVTHIVVVVNGGGTYQIDSSGAYIPWDEEVASLLGNMEPRPLRGKEDLVALRDFVAVAEGVSVADLTVYFAYSVSGTDVLVYSDQGASIRIQP